MKLLKLLHRWIGFPLGILFFLTLLTGVINGGEELFQLMRKHGQAYQQTTIEQDAAALTRLSAKYPAARQFLMPTQHHPFYQVRLRGETATYSVGDLVLLSQEASGNEFFGLILDFHRRILLGRDEILLGITGKDIVAWGGLLALGLSLIGLYLWWPMRKSFRLKNSMPKNSQRSSLQKSHINLGVLMLALIVLLALTGAGITYRSVARSVLDAEQQSQQGMFESPVRLENSWESWLARAKKAMPDASLERITMPRNRESDGVSEAGKINPRIAIQFRFNTASDWFGLAASKVYIDPQQSALIGVAPFGDKSTGQQLYELITPLHTGRGLTPGYLMVLLIPTAFTVMMVFFGVWSFWKKKSKLAEFKPKRNSIFTLRPMQWQAFNYWLARLFYGQELKFSSAASFTPMSGLLDDKDGSIKPLARNVTNITENKTATVLYATQTGNAEALADELKHLAVAANIDLKIVSVADYAVEDLAREHYLLLIVSTQGNGNVPDDAIDLYEALVKNLLELSHLKYSVLALGDSCYEFFCQAGKDFDELLCGAGATRIMARVDCNVEYKAPAIFWAKNVMEFLQSKLSQTSAVNKNQMLVDEKQTPKELYTKNNPYRARLVKQERLSGKKSNKDVRHVEFDLAGSGLHFKVGDGLGLWFKNAPSLVEQVISLCGLSANDEVMVGEQAMSLFEALTSHFELSLLHPGFIQEYALLANQQNLVELSEESLCLRGYMLGENKGTGSEHERKILDVLSDFPAVLSAQQLVGCLRKLRPRVYSIASSQNSHPSTVAITVSVVRYQAYGQAHLGAASGFLGERVIEGDPIDIFIEKNDRFRLPENPDVDIIMIGPGTGIAPFRAFLQEREFSQARGKNWFFFGNPNASEDYLYEDELQKYLKQGLLSRLDLAFSQDQSHKIYVQHRLTEQGAKVFAYLESGAHLYVCGDADKMAEDVHQALLDIVQKYGNLTLQQAQDYLSDLRRAKRYQRDVY